MAWLRLIRWKNLLIILATQLLAWRYVVLPLLEPNEAPRLLDTGNFIWLCLSTVLIAAAGYIINDYFDIRIDEINRPAKVVLEKKIHRRMAILTHIGCNLVALGAALKVARAAGHPEWILLQMVCTVLLWFYSTHFKRQFLTGNVVVALLTALTIVVLILYEPAMHLYALRPRFLQTEQGTVPNPVWVLGTYAYFAFMLTWMREVVKDMEDYKGDATEGCITMPIRWGLLRASRFVQVLSLLAGVPLILAGIRLLNGRWMPLGVYILVAIVLPLLLWTFYLPRKATQQHYEDASRILKFIMVLGVGSLIIYYRQVHG
jgi:4-hydroxybenzoate polyprenyltransferase